MLTPTANPPIEYLHNSGKSEQEAGLNAAVEYGVSKGWQLVAVMWVKEEAGEHYFNIVYNP